MPALLFGSISTLSDTSELQRAAFNVAFAEHGLDWLWERDEYQGLLTSNGGAQRIADYAAARGEDVDSAAIHQTKSEEFRTMLQAVPIRPRPGVLETVTAARDANWPVALVTTTSPENVDTVLAGLGLTRSDFALVVDTDSVETPKPDPAAYAFALEKLDVPAADCVAIEDNVGGLQSATAAKIRCVVFANENTSGHDFGDAARSAHLEFTELVGLPA